MKKNKAFTLGEVLVVFVIIGIIASISMITIKPWEKAYKYSYMRIFNALSISIYNYMATAAGTDAFPTTPKEFCNALITYMNTANDAQHGVNPCNYTTANDSYLGNTPTVDDFREGGKNPKILLSNGAKLWIGADLANNAPFSYTQIFGITSDTVKYYLVYVDLNGDNKPNAISYNASGLTRKLPDIVAFIVTDSFTVIPLGYPKVDQRYLSAHIMYPVTEEDDEASAEGERPSDAMTYYEALVGAYGKDPYKIISNGSAETYDIEESLPDANPFKLVKPNLDNKYVNAPVFDQDMCGDGRTAQQMYNDKRDSHCSIKVFNYN